MINIKKEQRSRTQLKKLFAIVGASALIAAPLLVALPSAEAQGTILRKDRPDQVQRGPNRDRDRDRDRGRNNDWHNQGYQTFTGRVTNVVSNQRFTVRTGSTTYNVVASSTLPRALKEGDEVRVYGLRSGNNDIRNANVTFIRGGSGSNGGGWGNQGNQGYQTFTGEVTDVDSNTRFKLRSGNTTYDVMTSSSSTRRLQRGDRVRVYGLRSGNNNIRNANVTYLNSGGSNQGGWGQQNNQNYRTYVGEVTDIDSNARFDLRVGNIIYNVKSSAPITRRLQKGDEVRVYGQRSGTNDIINANVSYIGAGSGGGSWGNQGNQGYQTFTGYVSDIDSNMRFDLRVGSTTYNVKPSTSIPRRLEKGDEVRVYGLRSGTNDIINANVSFIRGGRR